MSETTSNWVVRPGETKGGAGGEQRPIPEEGPQPAVCVGIVDLGVQKTSYKGQEGQVRKICIIWELTDQPDAALKGGHNFTLCRDYAISFAENANLRSLIRKWFGKDPPADGFDLRLLVQPKYARCMANVVHGESQKGFTYAKVEDVGGIPKGVTVPPAKRQPFVWTMGDPLTSLPGWVPLLYGKPIRHAILQALDFEETAEDASGNDEEGVAESDDIPFAFLPPLIGWALALAGAASMMV